MRRSARTVPLAAALLLAACSDYPTGPGSMPAGSALPSLVIASSDAGIEFSGSATNFTPLPATSISVPRPLGAAEGDLLLAQITYLKGRDVTITAPGGWTLVNRTDQSTNIGSAIYRKFAGGALDTGPYEWRFSQAVALNGGMLAYRGVDPDNPIIASAGATGTSGIRTAPSIPAEEGATLVAYFNQKKNTPMGHAAGMTERYTINPLVGDERQSKAFDQENVTNPTGTRSVTGENEWVAQSVTLRPAPKPIVPQDIILEPAEDENPAGTAHTVTATVEDGNGNPVVNREVRFEVISGPNAGQGSSGDLLDPGDGVCIPVDCHTDISGKVSWTYASNGQTGTDVIKACFTDDQGVERCAQATKTWTEVVIEVGQEGFMTGGGFLSTTDGTRVTFGLRLECDPADTPNSFQGNWGQGRESHRFHLEGLTSATCIAPSTGLDPGAPAAAFATHKGSGTGRYNGTAGATVSWTLVDAGEPGRNDTVELTIKDAAGNIVLAVIGTLEGGNLQAH